jgi:olfactory receptor
MKFLTGIPGLETQHGWLSIPIFIMYMVAIVGHSLIMAAVQQVSVFHEPMYLFFYMLAINEVGVSESTMPTVRSSLWFVPTELTLMAVWHKCSSFTLSLAWGQESC